MKRHLAILHGAALLVPRRQRVEWFAEWTSELWYVGQDRATAFCLGSFKDALWVRRNHPKNPFLESPWRCLSFLAALSAASFLLALLLSTFRREPAANFVPALIWACLVLPPTTSLSLGEYPGKRRLRQWIFLLTKLALTLTVVYYASIDLGRLCPWFRAGIVQGLASPLGCLFAFRWILSDQRRRCPVCLRLLTNPVRVGEASHNFLEWNGTELMCGKGHGLLHVPEIPTSCYTTQRWQSLDPSWSGLFS